MILSAPVNLKLVRQPRKYKSPLFVDREDELKIVGNKVRQAQVGEIITEPVVNFWGVGGIGKTWLLRRLHDLYQFIAEPPTKFTPLEHPTFALLYTFTAKSATASLPNMTKHLASQVLVQLSSVLSPEEQDLLVKANTTGNIEYLVQSLVGLSPRYVPLLLLDNAERVSTAAWQNLELQLIESLVIGGRIIVVIAGRRRTPRWRRFEVRRRAMEPDQTRIRAFSKSSVVKQINQRDYQVSAELLFPYTAGNPHLVEAIAKHVHDWANDTAPDQAWFDQHQNDLLLPILQTYEVQILENTPSHLRQVLYAVSPLRSYRLEALRFMLNDWKAKSEPQPDSYYLRILHELEQQTEIVWWSHERRAYTTDGMVRRVINRRMLLQNSQEYVERHRQALQMYKRWADEYPEASEDFIIEIWFHLASLFLVGRDRSALRAEAEQALRFAQEKLSSDRLLVLQKQLEINDKDKGDIELIDLLPHDLRDDLHQTLNQLLTTEYGN